MKDETGKECDGMDEGMQWAMLVQLSNLPVNLFLPKLRSVIFPVDFQSTSHIVDNVCCNFTFLIP